MVFEDFLKSLLFSIFLQVFTFLSFLLLDLGITFDVSYENKEITLFLFFLVLVFFTVSLFFTTCGVFLYFFLFLFDFGLAVFDFVFVFYCVKNTTKTFCF